MYGGWYDLVLTLIFVRVRITGISGKDGLRIKPVPEYDSCWIERSLIVCSKGMKPPEGKRVHVNE